jgi:hypothetical protein
MPNRQVTVDRYLFIEIANAADALIRTLTETQEMVNRGQGGEPLQQLLRDARERVNVLSDYAAKGMDNSSSRPHI